MAPGRRERKSEPDSRRAHEVKGKRKRESYSLGAARFEEAEA